MSGRTLLEYGHNTASRFRTESEPLIAPSFERDRRILQGRKRPNMAEYCVPTRVSDESKENPINTKFHHPSKNPYTISRKS